MKPYRGYLIDLDGTMYKGNQVIAEAPGFVRWLKERQIPFLFLTNNSTLPPHRVAEKLCTMGIEARPEEVYTSAMAAAEYLANRWQGGRPVKVYAIGEEGVRKALSRLNPVWDEENPDYVIVGLDRQFTYEKMMKASLAIQKGAAFISTNSDRALPTEKGLLPGNGSLTRAIEVASGRDAVFIGKPEPIMVELALRRLGVAPHEAVVVGDNLATDILAGVRAGVDTILVFTGITRRGEAEAAGIVPTHQVETLSDWMTFFP